MTFGAPLWLLALPALAGAALWVWGVNPPGGAASDTGIVRHRVALALRLLLLLLLVLSLAGMAWQQDVRRQAVVFVIDLSASDVAAQDRAEQWIRAALRAQGPDDLAGIVAVGRTALVEHPLARRDLLFTHVQSVVDPDYTNLAAGLDLAGAMLPADARRRVVVVTDGRQNIGDAVQAARVLRAEGTRVDVVPLAVQSGPEMLVDTLSVPSHLHVGETFQAEVRTQSTVGGGAQLELYQDDRLVGSRHVVLAAGSDRVAFALVAPPAGFHAYRAVLVPDVGADTLATNNEGAAFADVQGPPRVLVVENAPGAAHNVAAALRSQGITVDETPALRVVPAMAFLQRYAALFIVDTPASLLGPDLLALLPTYVRDLGHGLAVIGGPNSYALGGYAQTPLEEVLPVRMDIPQRKDTPTVAVALIVENLESDYSVNISKVAAEGVVKLLTPRDIVAVTDGTAAWAVTPRYVTDKAAIIHAVEAMQPIDPSSYADSLNLAAGALRGTHAALKHIILVGDGDAYDNYRVLAQRIAAAGITISTIATGAQGWSDATTMQDIARWGRGRFYRADSVETVPQIFLKEARRIARTGIVEEHFVPIAVSPSPLLAGITSMPQLDGYVATTPKAAAENVLISGRADPILASWQYGLGRAVAWTSDSAGQWTSHLLAWPGAARLWANMASWLLPPADNHAITLNATTSGGTGHLAVDVASTAATLGVTARLVDPTLQGSTVTLVPTAPGHYEAEFAAAHQGTYLVRVQVVGAGHGTLVATGGLVVPYSPEYRLTGLDRPTLEGIASAAGQMVSPSPSAAAAAFADDLPPVRAAQPLSWLLLLLAALLLPIDIAARRLLVTRADLAALLAAVRRGRRTTVRQATPAADIVLGARLRDRWARARAAGAAPRERPPLSAITPTPPPASPAQASTGPPETEKPGAAPPQPAAIPTATPDFSRQLLDAKRRRHR